MLNALRGLQCELLVCKSGCDAVFEVFSVVLADRASNQCKVRRKVLSAEVVPVYHNIAKIGQVQRNTVLHSVGEHQLVLKHFGRSV